MRNARLLRGGLIALMVAWAVVSLGSVPPLDDPTPSERASGGLIALAVLALIPFAFAAWRYGSDGVPHRGAAAAGGRRARSRCSLRR